MTVELGKADAGAHEDGAPTVMKQAMAMRKAGGPAGTTASTPASDERSELDSCMVLGSAGHQGLGCSLSDPSPSPFQLVTDAPPAGGRLPSPFGALVWLPLATVQPLTEAAPSTTSTVMVPWEQRRLAGEYVVESYAALKSLTACPDNSNAACDFSGKALIMRCNGKTLDANLEKRIFHGSGSESSLQVHGCVLTRGKTTVSVVLGAQSILLDSTPLLVVG